MADPGRTILGATQKQWLKDGLLNSTATFKFIMNGPPVTQLVFMPYDRWEAWSAERAEILDYIQTNNIKNVIWLSTDFHTILFSPTRLDITMTHPGIELVSGSIGENTLFRELPSSVLGHTPCRPRDHHPGDGVRARPLQRRPGRRSTPWRRRHTSTSRTAPASPSTRSASPRRPEPGTGGGPAPAGPPPRPAHDSTQEEAAGRGSRSRRPTRSRSHRAGRGSSARSAGGTSSPHSTRPNAAPWLR